MTHEYKLRVQIEQVECNLPLTKPYVKIILGNDKYKTEKTADLTKVGDSVYEFNVSLHAHLFWSLQVSSSYLARLS